MVEEATEVDVDALGLFAGSRAFRLASRTSDLSVTKTSNPANGIVTWLTEGYG